MYKRAPIRLWADFSFYFRGQKEWHDILKALKEKTSLSLKVETEFSREVKAEGIHYH